MDSVSGSTDVADFVGRRDSINAADYFSLNTLINSLLDHTHHKLLFDVAMAESIASTLNPYNLERQILQHLVQPPIYGAIYNPNTVSRYITRIKQNLGRRYRGGRIPSTLAEILRDEERLHQLKVAGHNPPIVELLSAFERDDLFRAVQTDTTMALADYIASTTVVFPLEWENAGEIRQLFVQRLTGCILREKVEGVYHYSLRLTPEQEDALLEDFPGIEFRTN